MTIDYKDFMHGAALVAVADSEQFTALNKASRKYGHYIVNYDRHLFVKYCEGAGPGDYSFTFNPSDKRRLIHVDPNARAFSVLVCGDEAIAALSVAELDELIELDRSDAQGLRVVAPAGKQLRFRGSIGELGPLPRSAFPRRVLE